jgi:peptidoglycan/xylan/chitin deacetylase (PgdA/CDA1 family)
MTRRFLSILFLVLLATAMPARDRIVCILSAPSGIARCGKGIVVTCECIHPGIQCEWSATRGTIVGDERCAVFTPDDNPGEAVIRCRVTADNARPVTRTLRLETYRNIVIVKADDYYYDPERDVSPRWKAYLDYVIADSVETAVGIIGKNLETGSSSFIEQTKRYAGSPNIEFFNHGYDHYDNKPFDGHYEFYGFDESTQREHLRKTQDLAKEKLGITLTAFGAPGNAWDAVTRKVVDEDPDLHVWLFGDSATTKQYIGNYLQVEPKVGTVSYSFFLRTGYEAHDYFLIQVHPAQWNDESMAEFKKVVAQMRDKKITFMTPEEFRNRSAAVTSVE